MEIAALLVSALLFGGMVLFSFGFAGFVFSVLPAEIAGPTIRRAFPRFYSFVLASAAVAAVLLMAIDPVSAGLMAIIAGSTMPTSQFLMPAINAATDSDNKRRFRLLHGLSVGITMAHIMLAGVVLGRFL